VIKIKYELFFIYVLLQHNNYTDGIKDFFKCMDALDAGAG
jgi:hypothetical protein